MFFDQTFSQVHAPNDFPWLSKHNFLLLQNHEALVMIKSTMTTTSQGLRIFNPEQRKCYFDGERDLKFFKIYTQSNCQLECLSNFTLKTCDCVIFSMPRNANITVCDTTKIDCFIEAKEKFSNHERSEEFDEISGENRGEEACNCQPSCTTIDYETVVSQQKVNDEENYAMNFHFTETKFVVMNRTERFGRLDLIGSCGGILGKTLI